MKQRMILPLISAALILVVVVIAACSNPVAPAPPTQPRATARPSRTTAPAANETAQPNAGPTQDVLDDSSGAAAGETPGAGPTQDPLDDSQPNPDKGSRTPKARATLRVQPTAAMANALMQLDANAVALDNGATPELAQAVQEYLNGRQVLFVWSAAADADAAVSQTIEHCSTHYILRGRSEQNTALTEHQSPDSRQEGTWNLAPQNNQLVLTYTSNTNQTQLFHLAVQTDGSVTILDKNVLARVQGPAICE